MACDELKAKLASLIEFRREIVQELHHLPSTTPPAERAVLITQLKQIGARITSTERGLQQCLNPPAPPVKAPAEILEVRVANPAPPADPDWATTIAGGTFPQGSGREWKQVLAPDEDYDQFTLVGASGWILDPNISSADLPFSHPFGFDWEFGMALDAPYEFLLARGNQKSEKEVGISADAARLGIPIPAGGLLGVEFDRGLVPPSFQSNVHEGDRVAVFGRWIVDCGHEIELEDGTTSYRSEIHPPLALACASTKVEVDGSKATRVLLTSRPYLMGQTYTTDTDTIYDDSADDDGTFYSHLVKEVVRVNTHTSFLVEAHDKVKSQPFRGAHLLHLVVRPPVHPAGPGSHGVGPASLERLFVSYQFTVRSGCAVQVTSSGPDTVDIFVSLSSGGYTPPPLPKRNGRRYHRDELKALREDAAKDYLEVEILSAAAQLLLPGSILSAAEVAIVLERGIETDEYVPLPSVNILDAGHAASAPANNIPAGAGVVLDDSQPYPIFGWLEVRFAPPVLQP